MGACHDAGHAPRPGVVVKLLVVPMAGDQEVHPHAVQLGIEACGEKEGGRGDGAYRLKPH